MLVALLLTGYQVLIFNSGSIMFDMKEDEGISPHDARGWNTAVLYLRRPNWHDCANAERAGTTPTSDINLCKTRIPPHNENVFFGRRDSRRSLHKLVRSPFALFPRCRKNQLGSLSEGGCYLLARVIRYRDNSSTYKQFRTTPIYTLGTLLWPYSGRRQQRRRPSRAS